MSDSQRLIGDVQRFGLLSAAAVVDRYRDLVDRAMDDPLGDGVPQMPFDGLELVDPSWLIDRASRLAAGYLRFLDDAAAASAARRSEPAGLERVEFPSAAVGEIAETSLWLHNPTEETATDLEVRVTALLSVEGESIPAGHITVAPRRVARLAAGDSCQIDLRVEVPLGLTRGSFFGLAHVSIDADHPVAIEVEVAGAAP